MSLTSGADKQPLYDPESLNGKQRRGADHTFKIQAAREAKKASKGNATSTNSFESRGYKVVLGKSNAE